MKKVILCLSLLAPSAYAEEPPKPMQGVSAYYACFDFLELKQKLELEHNEQPVISGDGLSPLLNIQSEKFELAAHQWYIFANPNTYKYTLVFKLNSGENGIGCIVSSGGNLGPVVKGIQL